MIQEIKYNGHTANPSDYECNDGDLAVSVDAVLEDGALRPVMPPTEVFETVGNYVVKYIHETSNFKHYIILYSNRTLVWKGEDGADTLHSFSTTEIYQVTGVGNTLVVLTAEGVHYFLWKPNDGRYEDLGKGLPELSLSFGLQGTFTKSSAKTVTVTYKTSQLQNGGTATGIDYGALSESCLASINEFISNKSIEAGKFLFPFMVRYAFRLYDGSLIRHSAPILMLASSLKGSAVQINCTSKTENDGKISSYRYNVVAVLHDLDYMVINEDVIEELKRWGDIITSVDVFVSAPFYTYDQNGECGQGTTTSYPTTYNVCKIGTGKYARRSFLSILEANGETRDKSIGVPFKDGGLISKEIRNCSNFYFLKSINIDNLATERTKIEVPKDYLGALVTRELMTDDYDSHDKLIAKKSFVYNSRLNLCGLTKSLFRGFHPNALFNYTDGYVSGNTEDDYKIHAEIVFVIRNSAGEDVYVQSEMGVVGNKSEMYYLYYPNINAYKAYIQTYDLAGAILESREIQLQKHDFLNGAFYSVTISSGTGGRVPTTGTDTDDIPVVAVTGTGGTVPILNKIYTSEVNNPFNFPVLGINTIGVGEIWGISSAAKALSEGQFGQFPLYAFTSDGVWALEVSATGTYSAKQPITRDICINPDSITQIDSAVLFATNRGIMLISGSQTQCITDIINSPDLFTLSDMPKSSDLQSVYQSNGGKFIDVELIPFLEFISNCKMVYDYIHQRILVFNFDVDYGYVYSMKSKTWSMFSTKGVVDTIPAYPEALVMKRVSRRAANVPHAQIITYSGLYDYSSAEDVDVTSLIVTRPFKMGDPNMLKTIDTIIQRGVFKKENIQQILYGSNDLYNWHIVWSSKDKFLRGFRGTPYKSFRLAIVCKMDKGENLYGCSVQFNPRQTNQLR